MTLPPMTEKAATWIRANAWLPFMRRQLWGGPTGSTYDAALALSVCACTGDVCHSCEGGRHQSCDRWALKPWPEWWLTNRPLDYVPPTAVWLAGRTCRSLCPCSCPRQMTKGQAAWVREHAWTKGMRKQRDDAPLAAAACACQYDVTHWCSPNTNQHGRCHRATPQYTWEAIICDRTGLSPVAFPKAYEHDTNDSATGPQRERIAMVWLADRVCRWVCSCACHAAPEPQAEQLDLFAEVAA